MSTDIPSSDIAIGRRGIPERRAIMEHVANGWVSSQRHPDLPITIFNYTHKCQYDRHWNDVTTVCRGLILDDDDVVVARPFPKFFNLGEHEGPLPDEPFNVYEKIDGSLFIVALYDDQIVTATRGSFVSEQAQYGRNLYLNHHRTIRMYPGFTLLFEVIYPENRIVVDYGDRRELVWLATIDNETGRTLPDRMVSFARAECLPVDFRNPKPTPNAEGYVVHFTGPSDLRVKVKFDEYVRLHRLVTGVNNRTIWEWMPSGEVESRIAELPDEMHGWATGIARELLDRFTVIAADASDLANETHDLPRKDAAERIVGSPVASVVFSMLDGKDWESIVWRMVKPQSFKPFRADEA